ncbi:plasmid partitioning protein RepB [Chelatococcus asaccharovorans]|uniref:plasmid partitioning protein RepB n=1 Tax=Chelatococcus asaccharovorans TaxID=28210 RepID=UPI00224C67F8|nr:plasmid partitioning protein RepB [Chelatococcus asaccharovorans]CAH1653776.1 ParB family chromosome partitioning protein [Chelatococcus asaccharovorans]CAH1694317.1 ParB family chromosome partitioning protein [Chelatococcus asaccharovorans]
MARKNLLVGLTAGEAQAASGHATSETAPHAAATGQPAPHFGVMGTRGAIGAVTRSIEQLKAHAVVEIDCDLVERSFITDRLEGSAEDHRSLVASIREHGQQVPVLVRPHPAREGRYQIAYGHRRLRAVAELGIRLRAMVKPLTDEQLVVAQGQENSARTDLSFIEKALFAARLEEAGFKRDTLMAALSVDKTGLSRLISAAVKVPRDIIAAIGPAPKAGRDRWLALAERLEASGAAERAREASSRPDFAAASSDDRFLQILEAVAPKRRSAEPAVWSPIAGKRLLRIKDDATTLTLMIDKKAEPGFGDYLIGALPEIYAAFQAGSQGSERKKDHGRVAEPRKTTKL